MQRTISKAESYCKTLHGQRTALKESKLFAKFGAILGIQTCKVIAQRF
tara:strand:- start:4154 stop:4297 length:144 start_codon:yes stop_codon:yes gene_type:complete